LRTTVLHPLSLHAALPISAPPGTAPPRPATARPRPGPCSPRPRPAPACAAPPARCAAPPRRHGGRRARPRWRPARPPSPRGGSATATRPARRSPRRPRPPPAPGTPRRARRSGRPPSTTPASAGRSAGNGPAPAGAARRGRPPAPPAPPRARPRRRAGWRRSDRSARPRRVGDGGTGAVAEALDGGAVAAPAAHHLVDPLVEDLLVLARQLAAHRVVVEGAGAARRDDVEARQLAAGGAAVSVGHAPEPTAPDRAGRGPAGGPVAPYPSLVRTDVRLSFGRCAAASTTRPRPCTR